MSAAFNKGIYKGLHHARPGKNDWELFESFPVEIRNAMNDSIVKINCGSVAKVYRQYGLATTLVQIKNLDEIARVAHYKELDALVQESEAKGLLDDLGL